MFAISSYRPFGESTEADANQLKAKATWDRVGWNVLYFSPVEEKLKGSKTDFWVPPGWPDKPIIQTFCSVAKAQSENFKSFACIINADIQVDKRADKLESELNRVGAKCGYSLRFAPGEYKARDLGIDFFVANQEVWGAIADVFPSEYQIGKGLWDTSMLAHMVNMFPNHCRDITPCRLIFHPIHGQRGDQSMETPASDQFIRKIHWAKQKLIY